MRVHHARFGKRNVEELIVEAFHFTHEGAPARVAAPDGIRIRIVHFVDIKAGSRDVADAVRAGQQHLPELFRRIDLARQPAGAADNGDRLFRSLPHRRHRRRLRPTVALPGGDLRRQRLGHLRDAWVVECEHAAQRHAQRFAERLRQNDGIQRIQSAGHQRLIIRHRPADRLGRRPAHQRQQILSRSGRCPFNGRALPPLQFEARYQRHVQHRARPVDRRHAHRARMPRRQQPLKHRPAQRIADHPKAGRFGATHRVMPYRHARVRPRAPLNGQHSLACLRPALRQRIQPRVGRRIARLPRRPEGGRRRGVQHHKIARYQAVMQVLGTPHFHRPRLRQLLGRLVGQRAVRQDARGVDNPGHRRPLLRRQPVPDRRHVGGVRHVAGQALYLHALPRRQRRRPAAARQQQQMRRPLLCQIARRHLAQRAVAAADHIGRAGADPGPFAGRQMTTLQALRLQLPRLVKTHHVFQTAGRAQHQRARQLPRRQLHIGQRPFRLLQPRRTHQPRQPGVALTVRTLQQHPVRRRLRLQHRQRQRHILFFAFAQQRHGLPRQFVQRGRQ
ncbi:Uncharacterised protein [Serratia marcescens]|nr:Uncharacterised protein [Serratia marcescens]